MTFIRLRLSRDVSSAALKQFSQKGKDVPIKRQRNYSIKSGTSNKQVAKMLKEMNTAPTCGFGNVAPNDSSFLFRDKKNTSSGTEGFHREANSL